MDIYISHLLEHENFFRIVSDYPVNIETIEFSIASVLDKGASAFKAYEKLSPLIQNRKIGLHGPFLDLFPGSFDDKVKQTAMDRFNEAYEAACYFKASHIIFHSGFYPLLSFKEGWIPKSITFWQEFMKDKTAGIPIYLENVFDPEPEPLFEVLKSVNHPLLGACLDIGHVNAYSKQPLEAWFQKLSPFICHLHLHNNDGSKDSHKGLLNGTLSPLQVMELIKNYAPSASCTLEVPDEKELRCSLQFLTQEGLLKR